MRAVFSATRRSFASAAIALASSRCGARRTSRWVSRTASNLSRSVGWGSVSRQVIAGLLVKSTEGEPASRLPLGPWNPFQVIQVSAGALGAGGPWVHRLFGRSLRHRKDGYVGAAFGFGIERDATIDLGEEGVVLADSDILAGVPLGAALARDNVAGQTGLPAKQLDAE